MRRSLPTGGRRRALAALLLTAALAVPLAVPLSGCGQLPRPFQPSAKDVNLQALLARKTLYVTPIDSLARGTDFAVALAAALEAQGLQATPNGTASNRVVRVRAAVRPEGDHERVDMQADVLEPDGQTLVTVAHSEPVPPGDVQAGDPFVLAALADGLASALAARLAPAPIEQAALPGFPGARLVVLPISGAPGDGADALPAALRAALERRNLPLARERGPQDLLVAGTVTVVPAGPGQERATIEWRLLEAGTGGAPGAEIGPEIGRVAQTNRIPAGQLDGRWGRIADLVADYAAEGLEDLLDRAADRRG